MFKNLRLKHLVLAITSVFLSSVMFGQTTISGTIYDSSTKETLFGASVIIKGTTSGTQTTFDGSFNFSTTITGNVVITVSYIGYVQQSFDVNLTSGEKDLGKIYLESDAIGMEELNVIANIAVDRKTPVASSSVSATQVALTNGGKELPEALNGTPAVYATKAGGGFGDSRINVRGFDQRNVAVLINGVPVNDMENGWVYWSNWAGLGDAVENIQLQRGLGASKLAINSVGGTMNIITKTTQASKGGSVEVSLTDYGKTKSMISLSSGRLNGGWAFSFVGSRTSGKSYVDGTYIDAWSYYLSAAKQLNDRHLLQFTVIGAPQEHGQRDNSEFSAQSYDSYSQRGGKYNPNWGYAKGEFLNERNNFYHKPQIALNWFWDISENSYLSTAAYVSTGKGGGSGILGKNPVKYGAPSNALGQRDWDYAIDINDTSSTGSYLIMRNSVNNHFWTGILSSFNQNISENLTLVAGVDGRYYKGEHYREVRDLLGGEYWGDAVTPEARVGDRIAYDNDGTVGYAGLFVQLEYATDNLSAYIAGTVSNTSYGRTDRYNFERGRGDLNAEAVNQVGYNGKIGLNYNINEHHNVFLSGGYYSRAPFHNFIYINFGNDINPNISNEIITAGEIGYGFISSWGSIKLNGYYTGWADKWTKLSYTDELGNSGTYYIQGLDETHVGAEIEAMFKLTNQLNLGVFGSLGDWYYNSDTSFERFDENNDPIDDGQLYAKDLKVGDAPQTQLGAKLNYNLNGKFIFGISYTYNDELYAKFDPSSRQDPTDREQSYKLDAFGLTDAYVQMNFPIGKSNGSFTLNANNLFDVEYAAEGWDNATRDADGNYTHGRDNFKGFWGWGRYFNFALKIDF